MFNAGNFIPVVKNEHRVHLQWWQGKSIKTQCLWLTSSYQGHKQLHLWSIFIPSTVMFMAMKIIPKRHTGWESVEQKPVYYSFVIVPLACSQLLIIVITEREQTSAAISKRTNVSHQDESHKHYLSTQWPERCQCQTIIVFSAAKDFVTYKDPSHSCLRILPLKKRAWRV